MPSRSNRDQEPSADFFAQPEAGSVNGVERPGWTDTAEWNVDALRVERNENSADLEEPWDLDALRLAQDFDAEVGGKKLLTTVPVRKPTRQEFVRVHPDPAWHLGAALLEVQEDNENYLVVAALQRALLQDVLPVDLVTTINRTGTLFLWPVKLPKSGKGGNAWLTSAQEAARLAQQYWIKMTSNRELGAYEITRATGQFPEPEWPSDMSFAEMLKLAFKDHVIQNFRHPVLRRLRGEI
jgi:hypothetical protein